MDKDLVKALAMATSAGLTLVFCIGGFIWIGYTLDGWFRTEPLCCSRAGQRPQGVQADHP